MNLDKLEKFILFLFVYIKIQLGETLSHVCLTFLAALILCLMFESPIHGIEKMLLRRSSLNNGPRKAGSETDDFNVNSHSPSTSEASA